MPTAKPAVKAARPTTVKQKPYTDLNPNGRMPTLEDPNTGIKIWESDAIIKYLIETYDKSNQFTITTSPEKYHLEQMFFFQATGQGPYYGQWVFFLMAMPENKQALQRYEEQTVRVWGVLDNLLEGKEYLVGNKW